MHKISIITVNRNNAAGLEKTVRSVICQSYRNIEYILIDGASTDASVDIIVRYASKIHYWVSEPDGGIYNGMNKGVRKATGDYLLFVNSGDCLYESSTIAKIAHQISEEDIIYGNIGIFYYGKLRVLRSPRKIEYFKKYQQELPPHPATFIKRKLLDTVGLFDERNQIISDMVLIARIFASEEIRYRYVNTVITIFDTSGISSKRENQNLAYEERRKFILSEFPQYLNDFEKVYRQTYPRKLLLKLKSCLVDRLIWLRRKGIVSASQVNAVYEIYRSSANCRQNAARLFKRK